MDSGYFKKKTTKPLPDAPGVYFFLNKNNKILYIGRATSLRDRVKSYFKDDLIATRGQLLVDMVATADHIKYEQADSVLEAIILESNLIKKHQPYYNTKEKDDRSYNYVIITEEEFPRVIVVRGRELEKTVQASAETKSKTSTDMPAGSAYKIRKQFGPYPQGALLREALAIIRKIFPFRDARARVPYNEAFYQSIGLSPDTASPEARKEYARTIRNLTLFFEGKKKALVRALEREMKAFAKTQQFEKAGAVKKTLYALGHIQDVSLIKRNNESFPAEHSGLAGGMSVNEAGSTTYTPFRIEAYDVAHLGGSENVGVMTVVENGEIEKTQYRKFKISRDVNNDVASLTEILRRRLEHTDWPMPNIIVVDGGTAQINAAENILNERGLGIPVVSVVKDEHHRPRDIMVGKTPATFPVSYRAHILVANSEAHRFAITFHRKRLEKKMML